MTIQTIQQEGQANSSKSIHKQFIITGIDTNVGKTVVAAIFAKALNATYWKPIQAGDLAHSDTMNVQKLTRNTVDSLPEAIRLLHPMSPHAAAKLEGVTIQRADLALPHIEGNLIIEGAGGLLVPVNEHGLVLADVMEDWKLPVVLVARHYLGSINHTLLSIEVLKNRKLPLAGIVFVGENPESEAFILQKTGVKLLLKLPYVDEVTPDFVAKYALELQQSAFQFPNSTAQ